MERDYGVLLSKKHQSIIYKELGLAKASPSGTNYAPQQTVDAWQKTMAFLKKYLGA